ncbi:NAD(P)/FAD-dependent oxidoreductase [Candidatus Methylocalor cossyra]|uniref:Nitric oxide reductase FlRd-NAD(+) reductase n=1 Tax=Candidatus Methylocalor cossyra TaxID=3108543 RepID=A0ABP1C795_9GAMM
MHVVVIGSGVAGTTFAEEFRKARPDAQITLVTRERHGHYARPMLSHGFSREDVETKIMLRTFDELQAAGIAVQAGTEVEAVERSAKTVRCRAGGSAFTLGYDTLVLAPGSEAFIPPPFQAARDLFQVVNSLDDLLALRRLRAELMDQGRVPRWAVVGGGLIGCEAASDLAKAGDRVVLFHALPRLMERQLVEEDSATLLQVLEAQGIQVRLSAAVTGFEKTGPSLTVHLVSGSETGFDGIIVACGFKPRTELAEKAGLPVNRGIRVDAFLRTEDPAIYALGDAAECPDGRLYAYIMPIRHQAAWLAQFLAGATTDPWQPPAFKPRAKVHGFLAAHPYLF